MTTSTANHTVDEVLRPSEEAALAAWRELIRANAEQVARLHTTDLPSDFWAPGRRESPIYNVDLELVPDYLKAVRDLVDPSDALLDIGAGVGRQAVYLSQYANQVLAYDPSPGMTARLKENVMAFQANNVQVLPVDGWPSTASHPRDVDVCLSCHVSYFVEEIGAFLDAMEKHARRLCVVVANERGTGWQPVEPLFERVHGERFVRLPALPELLALLGARRRQFSVQTFKYAAPGVEELEGALRRLREDHMVEDGTDKDAILKEALHDAFGVDEKRVRVPSPRGDHISVISWVPPEG